jgi:hypothetical protein
LQQQLHWQEAQHPCQQQQQHVFLTPPGGALPCVLHLLPALQDPQLPFQALLLPLIMHVGVVRHAAPECVAVALAVAVAAAGLACARC